MNLKNLRIQASNACISIFDEFSSVSIHGEKDSIRDAYRVGGKIKEELSLLDKKVEDALNQIKLKDEEYAKQVVRKIIELGYTLQEEDND